LGVLNSTFYRRAVKAVGDDDDTSSELNEGYDGGRGADDREWVSHGCEEERGQNETVLKSEESAGANLWALSMLQKERENG
jgi:hypothetical protein